ncbi:MAG: hypothetical protein AUK25_11510 [Desulfobacteraceae bacterium CG2_30_51_40]|nr:MAG: hypothetical protein AUK25_11510 [Desulfobacteraceae bacterium CG2_30_51_40]
MQSGPFEGPAIVIPPALPEDTYSPQELMAAFTDIGRQHYVNPQDRVLFKKILDREGSIRTFETPLFKKDGNVLWAPLNARAVRDKE